MDNTIVSINIPSSVNCEKKYMSIIKRFFSCCVKMFALSILILISAIIITYFVVLGDKVINKISGKNVPALLSTYVVVSPSMSPAIKIQDAVLVVRKDASKLKKGDIITFKSSDQRYKDYVITHRIDEVIKTSSGEVMFRTKGDNNELVDGSLVSADQVYGKVMLKLPGLGFLQYIVSKPLFFLVLIIIPLLLIIGLVVRKVLNNKEKEVLIVEEKRETLKINENGNDIIIEFI